MILTSTDIHQALRDERIRVDPLTEKSIRPASIDLRLHRELLIYLKPGVVDSRKNLRPIPEVIPLDDLEGYPLYPGAWLLAATHEYISISRGLVGIICGKSSLARDGISIEDAGYVDPMWQGRLTLEIKNNGPLTYMLYMGQFICQIRFMEVKTESQGYGEIEGSHYSGSVGPVMNLMESPARMGASDTDRWGRPNVNYNQPAHAYTEDCCFNDIREFCKGKDCLCGCHIAMNR